jgi:FkbM family methyltransferase
LREIVHAIIWTKRHLLGQLRVEEMSAIQELITADDTCFDIGAHAGSWAVPLSDLVPGGHVYAFEALPYYARVLKKTIRLLRRKNITVISRAVVDNDCSVNIIWKDVSGRTLTGTTHVAGPDEKLINPVLVEGMALDTFLDQIPIHMRRVRFVKMDIEGAELLALRGATKLIETCRPIFYVELWSQYCKRYRCLPTDVFKFFSENEYKPFVVSSGSQIVPVDSADYPGRGDVLFIPTEGLSALHI